MADGRIRGTCCAALLCALFVAPPPALASSGREEAALLCEKAEGAERDARDAEKKSQERQKFLKAAHSTSLHADSQQIRDTSAIRQSINVQLAKARDLLPQIRQGMNAAKSDQGVVPGLGQYFAQMESTIHRLLQASETCLENPEFCRMPVITCPQPPPLPSFSNTGSANLIRNVQQSYTQAANQARQACQNLNNEMQREMERLKRESSPTTAPPATSPSSPGFGEVDLLAKRAESLKRDAAQYRQEADRLAKVSGYCAVRGQARADTASAQALVSALKSVSSPAATPQKGLAPNATVTNLKTAWQQQWNQGKSLKASDVPLPKLSVADQDPASLEEEADDGPGWGARTKEAYRKADEQMELTEFIMSRPKELVKDVAKELIEMNLGAAGKTLTTGYTILSAVKATSDEVGGILLDAPRAIASTNPDEAAELMVRTERVPLNFLNSVFDDVTGKFPPPRYTYQYKGAGQ
jgi:hypothetical protein